MNFLDLPDKDVKRFLKSANYESNTESNIYARAKRAEDAGALLQQSIVDESITITKFIYSIKTENKVLKYDFSEN